MTIETLETQKIVNRLMNILGKNINIMSRDGIIVASGDKSRVGDFHGAARDAALQKKEVIVNEGNKTRYEGSKFGVNIPIYYKGEVLGVVGITGEPAEVKGYGLIVKELVELMIQEEERRSFELFQSRAVKNFAKELIRHHDEEDYKVLTSRAKLVQFDANVSRAVVVFDICSFSSIISIYKENSEVMIQKLKQQIVDAVSSISNPDHDIVVNIADDHFIIFKSTYEDLKSYCHRVEEVLQEKLGIKAYIGVGRVCKDLGDYHKAYQLAVDTVNIGRKHHPDKLIYFFEDYKLQLLLLNISEDKKQQFLSSYGILFENDKDDNKELLKTAKTYFENRMSIKDTANALYVHRNTILYRINKFKESFSIDITDPYQCMMVYIGLNLME
jgi:carbohydrate diacid regulator